MSPTSVSNTKQWYLVYTKRRDEQLAESNLIRQGYTVYLPQICKCRRSRGKFRAFIEPMFPRYLLSLTKILMTGRQCNRLTVLAVWSILG